MFSYFHIQQFVRGRWTIWGHILARVESWPLYEYPWLYCVVIRVLVFASFLDKQDCFLQKEARVCVSNAFVIEDSQLHGVFCCGIWASDRGSRYANVNIVVEWKGILAEGTVVWNDSENNVVKIIKSLLTHCGLVTPYVDIDLGRHLLR